MKMSRKWFIFLNKYLIKINITLNVIENYIPLKYPLSKLIGI
jgi:hypothetical protein